MQNIIEAEDDVKGMPDQALQRMAQQPDGRYPQFLVVSEIQRRSNMRKRFEAQQQPQGTVKDQIVQQGIASLAPPPPQMQQAMGVPQQMPQGAPMPPQMPPQGMYAGGVVNMNTGQQVPYVTYPQRQFGRGIPVPQLTDAGREATASLYGGITQQRPGELETLYRNELVGMPMEEYDALLAQGYTPTMTGGLSREGQPRDTVMFDPELAQRLTGSDKFRSEFFDTGMDSGLNEDYNRAILAEFAQNNPDKFSMISASDSPRAYLKMIEDLEGIEGEGSGPASGPADTSYLDDPMFDEFPPVDPEQDLKDMFNDPQFTAAAAAPKVQPQDAAQIAGSNAAKEDAAKADPLETAQAQVAAALGNKNQAVSAYQKMIERANTKATEYETQAALRANELRADAKKDMLANALIELGSGIAGGDLAGGLSRAGRTAADLKARIGTEARAEERSGREMAEAARQRAEGLTLEEMAKVKEEERYQESVNTAASQFAAQMADKVAARQFTADESEADRAARLEQITYQLEEGFKNDQALLETRIAQEKSQFSQKREDEQRETLISLVNQAIDSDTYQTILMNEFDNDAREAKEKEIRARLTSEFRKQLVGDKYKITKRSP
jgi:hypothetical protein